MKLVTLLGPGYTEDDSDKQELAGCHFVTVCALNIFYKLHYRSNSRDVSVSKDRHRECVIQAQVG